MLVFVIAGAALAAGLFTASIVRPGSGSRRARTRVRA